MGEDAKTIAEAKAAVRAMNAQRRFPEGTTPACRHVAMMAEMLSGNGTYPMLADEPRHCATSLAATVRMLWEARAALRALPSATQAGGENQALRAMIRVNMLRYGPADLTHEDIDRQIEAAIAAIRAEAEKITSSDAGGGAQPDMRALGMEG